MTLLQFLVLVCLAWVAIVATWFFGKVDIWLYRRQNQEDPVPYDVVAKWGWFPLFDLPADATALPGLMSLITTFVGVPMIFPVSHGIYTLGSLLLIWVGLLYYMVAVLYWVVALAYKQRMKAFR